MTVEKNAPIVYRSEGEVLLALRDHFDPKEYVVLPQVRNGAGFSATRTADAIVMSTWPSRGLAIYGIEIKVSRGDWLRELKDPQKCDDIAKFCDYWVVAVGDGSIVKPGELPVSWGLLVPGKNPGTLKMHFTPQKMEASPLSRNFLAPILRKALEITVPLAGVDAEIERRVKERVAELEIALTKRLKEEFDPTSLIDRNTKLLAAVDAFKEITGCWLDAYNADELKRVARVFKLMRYSQLDQWLGRLEGAAKDTIKHVKDLREALPPEQRKDSE